MELCDLHTHSIYSDGTWTPVQILEEAERIGLKAVALTDHNTIDGLPEFLAAAQGRGVEAVAGVEFSTGYQGKELHILALFLKPEHFDTVRQILAESQRRKDESNAALVAALNQAGYALDYDKIKAATPNGFVNRAHIGAELTRLGYTESVKEAFRQLLSPKCGYYKPPERMTAFDCIRLIKSLDAVAVLAHPLLTLDEAALRRFLTEAEGCGLDGMETRYVTYDAATTALAEEIAAEFDLLASGGSDFHGNNKPDIDLGNGRGELQVPARLCEQLKARCL